MATTLVALTPAQLAQMTPEQIAAYVAKLAANQKAPAKQRAVEFAVGEKGGIIVKGIRAKFPIMSPYPDEARRVAKEVYGLTDEQYENSPIGKFEAANKNRLSYKNTEEAAEAAA